MNKSILVPLIACFVSAPSFADFSLGLVTSYSPNVYIGADSDVVPFPLVSLDTGRFFIEGTSMGYRLEDKGSVHNVLFRAIYDPRTLKPSDSDDTDIQKLEERDASFLGGVTYQLTTKAGIVELGLGTDIGSVHNGLYGEVQYRLPIHLGSIGFIPNIGYSYNSDKLNQHLYGVSANEARNTRFDEFTPSSSGEVFVGLSSYMYVSKSIRLTASVRYSNLDGEVADSPIIDNDESVMGSLGVAYTF